MSGSEKPQRGSDKWPGKFDPNDIDVSAYHPNAKKVAREIYSVFGVKPYTYNNHGITGYNGDKAAGDSAAIDFYVVPAFTKARGQRKKLGTKIRKYLEKHHERLGVEYTLWYGWQWWPPIGYKRYTWAMFLRYARNHGITKPNKVNGLHLDHDHTRIKR